MHKILSSVLLVGFIVSTIKADATAYQPPTSQVSQVASDIIPQTPYVPAAATYQNSDSISLLNNQAYDPGLFQSFVNQDAVQAYVSQYGNGYAGQALEGYLIPTLKQTEVAPLAPTFIGVLKSILPGPKILLVILAKLAALAASAIGIVFFGGAVTTFVCAFTPLCTITFFGLPLALLRKETKEIVEKIGTEITADRIKRAADLFKLAYDKYNQMQNA